MERCEECHVELKDGYPKAIFNGTILCTKCAGKYYRISAEGRKNGLR